MAYSQDERLIAIDTPLGKDVLLLQGFSGHEGVSQLFHFDVEVVSEDAEVAFDKIIGQRVTLRMALPDGDDRYINGFVSRFTQATQDQRFTSYRMEIVPWLWFLTRTTDCRIFQHLTVPEIIEKIFRDLGFDDFRFALQGNFEPREYCVQYRETDYNFVARLMEEYGICYFFQHEKNKHTLTLANVPGGHPPCAHQETVRCAFGYGGVEKEDVINDCQVEQEFRPGKYAHTDYNFETPSTSLMANVASTVAVGGNSKYEIYDYPGEHAQKSQGDQLAKLRIEAEEATHFVLSGASTCRAFVAGHRVTLTEHYRNDLNKAFLLLEVQHNASVGEAYVSGKQATEYYTNHFIAIPHATPYRPPRVTARPSVQGPQTAVVVGKAGEEIWTDKYGRVKVQFHWDREGKRNENSSCWIRVSHPWAGKAWGGVAIPRIGQEVVVDFLEGDPDQPLITGRVYNAEQMPPYDLPANQTQTGIKSRSSKGGGEANFNELRFEDKKGEEQVYIHAERNLDGVVEVDESRSVGHDRQTTIGNDENIKVGNNRTEHVERGHETITIHTGNQTYNVNSGHATLNVLTKNRDVNVNSGNYQLTVATKNVIIKAGDKIIELGTNEVEISSAKIKISASQEIQIGVGSNSITINTQGVQTGAAKITTTAVGIHEISGAMIKLN